MNQNPNREKLIQTLKDRQELLNKEYIEIQKNSLANNLSWDQFQDRARDHTRELDLISQNLRFMEEPTFREMPTYGRVFSMKEFINMCKSGDFIDYDGSGNYVRDGKMSDITVYPSDITSNNYRKDFTHVIWFNR